MILHIKCIVLVELPQGNPCIATFGLQRGVQGLADVFLMMILGKQVTMDGMEMDENHGFVGIYV